MSVTRTPAALCWHCDRLLDAATSMENPEWRPEPGSVSLCLYCGAVAIFTGVDLMLRAPSEAELDELGADRDFGKKYMSFSWARQYVMRRDSLLRDRIDPDR